MTEKFKTSDKLLDEYIELMKRDYGVIRSRQEADDDLESLGRLFLSFSTAFSDPKIRRMTRTDGAREID